MPCPLFEREAIEAEIDHVRSLGVHSLRTLWRTTFRSSPPSPSARTSWRDSSAGTFRSRPSAGWIPRLQSIWVNSRGAAGHEPSPRRLKPGTVLLREYQGERHTVTVVANGYVWREATYASLSIIARAITGTAWNGPRFFGLRIDKGITVSPDAADTSPGAPNGRHLAWDSGSRPRQATVAQCPSDKSAATITPLHGGSADHEAGRSKTPALRHLHAQIDRA